MKEVLAIDVSMHRQRRLAMHRACFCLTFQKDPIKRSQMAVRAFLCYNKICNCLIYSAKGAVFFARRHYGYRMERRKDHQYPLGRADEEFLHRLRHVGHRDSCAAGRARRPEARTSPHPLRDERSRDAAGQGVQEVGPHRR